MPPGAYSVHNRFEAAAPMPFRMDRHYFLYALEGSMRLEADGQRWALPPARAALVEAGREVMISIPSRLVSASVLFDRAMFTPARPLAVFDVTPLARELVRECRDWGPETPDTPYARQVFGLLATAITQLAETPSPCVLPIPTSTSLARALALTEQCAAAEPNFAEIARATGQSTRALARRFTEEMGMTWREALRRIRIIRAVEILATSDASITEVALMVGYTSLSAFNAAFRELMGQTPSHYRMTFRS